MKFTASICLLLLIAHSSLFFLSQEIIIIKSKIDARFWSSEKEFNDKLKLVQVVQKGASIEDEMTFKGRLYDIVRTVEHQDSVYCYGIQDESEEEANASLASAFQSQDNLFSINDLAGSRHHAHVLSFDQYYIYHTQIVCGKLPFNYTQFPESSKIYLSASLEHSTPPPKVFS